MSKENYNRWSPPYNLFPFLIELSPKPSPLSEVNSSPFFLQNTIIKTFTLPIAQKLLLQFLSSFTENSPELLFFSISPQKTLPLEGRQLLPFIFGGSFFLLGPQNSIFTCCNIHSAPSFSSFYFLGSVCFVLVSIASVSSLPSHTSSREPLPDVLSRACMKKGNSASKE